MFEACVAMAVPGASAEERVAAAAALQVLYSATAWDQLRSFWGMDAERSSAVIELAIRSLLRGLETHLSEARSERAPPGPTDGASTPGGATPETPGTKPRSRR